MGAIAQIDALSIGTTLELLTARGERAMATGVAGGGAGPTGITSSFVFQPGGTAGGNVFIDWPSLIAAVDAVQGVRQVLLDGQFTTCTVPAGAWNVQNVQFFGTSPDFSLTFADGATFTGENFYFDNLTLTVTAAEVPVISVTGSAEIQLYFTSITATGGAPFASVSVDGSLFILADADSLLGNNSTPNPVLAFASVAANNTLQLAGNSNLQNNATSGAGGLNATIGIDCTIGSPQMAGIHINRSAIDSLSLTNAGDVPVAVTDTVLVTVIFTLDSFQLVDLFAEADFQPLAGTANDVTLRIVDDGTDVGVAVVDHTTTTGASQVSITKIGLTTLPNGAHVFNLVATATGGTTGCHVPAGLARLQVRAYN